MSLKWLCELFLPQNIITATVVTLTLALEARAPSLWPWLLGLFFLKICFLLEEFFQNERDLFFELQKKIINPHVFDNHWFISRYLSFSTCVKFYLSGSIVFWTSNLVLKESNHFGIIAAYALVLYNTIYIYTTVYLYYQYNTVLC